jgi:hypothetical protein
MDIFLFVLGLIVGFTWGRYALNPRRSLRRITNGAYVLKPLLMGIVLGGVLVVGYSLLTQ